MKIFRSALKDEKGQVFVLSALLLPIIILFVGGLALDIGWVTYNKTKLKKASDLAVLAAGQDMPEKLLSKDPLTLNNYDCTSHIDIETTEKTVALNYFCDNYSSDSVTEITLSNGKVPGQEFFSLHAHLKDDIDLFFAPIIGINSMSISATSSVAVPFLVKPPSEVIPIALDNDDVKAMLAGTYAPVTTCPAPQPGEMLIWGEDNKGPESTYAPGNFGIVYLDTNFAVSSLQSYVADGYPHTLPPVGTKIDTKTGSMAEKVVQGFKDRLTYSLTDPSKKNFYMPLLDYSTANGKTTLEVLGYTRMEALRAAAEDLGGGKFRACIYAVLTETIHHGPDGVFEKKGDYYGVKKIVLYNENYEPAFW